MNFKEFKGILSYLVRYSSQGTPESYDLNFLVRGGDGKSGRNKGKILKFQETRR